ncbi:MULTISPECIES: hypothetical protein [Streptomyces]|uniref:hypothetical protein n=1 Tax=Streptomyces TaxID=1883 RepID=UPI0032530F1A
MSPQPHTGHRAVIQTAIEDWWITADLPEPFNPHAVATQIELYLNSSGYTITPDIPRNRMPSRTALALSASFALVCLSGAIAFAVQTRWGWSLISLVGAGVYTYELLGDLAERRYRLTARPIVIDRPESRQP